MSWNSLRALGAGLRRNGTGKVLVVGASVAGLVGMSMLFTGSAAQSLSARAAARQAPYVLACPQRTGPPESKGDLNVRRKACGKGQKPLKLARYPVAAAQGPQGPEGPQGAPGTAANAEFGVATVFVSRG